MKPIPAGEQQKDGQATGRGSGRAGRQAGEWARVQPGWRTIGRADGQATGRSEVGRVNGLVTEWEQGRTGG